MRTYKVIGIMSGTSLDGLDLCYCHIWKKNDAWEFKIKQTKSITYHEDMQMELKNCILLKADELLRLHNSYGIWLGEQVSTFVSQNNLAVDLIASHGHTSHHRPQDGFTFQIGSGQHLANTCAIQTVCDFRTNDIALGGQGAPLVPIGDRIFFGQYDFCLNLGGISNISFELNEERVAYDIGLANMILNHITRKIGLAYDDDGKLAKKGTTNKKMLKALNALKYYALPFPKSIGYEWFLKEVAPIVDHTDDTVENLLHTAIHHICEQVVKQITLNSDTHTVQSLLVTGGGALNGFLMETLKTKLSDNVKPVIPSKTLITFKEALIFALMGVLRAAQETNVLCSVTGAKRDSSSGVLFLPN